MSEIIYKKHSEKHTFFVGFDRETLGDNHDKLYQELELFAEAWQSCEVTVGTNYVTFSYSGYLAARKADGASDEFRNAVKRHPWWKEIQL